MTTNADVDLLSKRETAAILRVSVATVERLIRTEQLKAVRLLGSTRVKRTDLDALLSALPAVKYRHRAGDGVVA